VDKEYKDLVAKYLWVLDYIGDSALDIYCGEGHGTSIISQVVREAIGVDPNEDNIRRARRRYSNISLSFQCKDIGSYYEMGMFDTVICFDADSITSNWKEFLDKIFNKLVYENGDLIFSVPFKKAKEAKDYFIGYQSKFFIFKDNRIELASNFSEEEGILLVILAKEKFNWLERIKL